MQCAFKVLYFLRIQNCVYLNFLLLLNIRKIEFPPLIKWWYYNRFIDDNTFLIWLYPNSKLSHNFTVHIQWNESITTLWKSNLRKIIMITILNKTKFIKTKFYGSSFYAKQLAILPIISILKISKVFHNELSIKRTKTKRFISFYVHCFVSDIFHVLCLYYDNSLSNSAPLYDDRSATIRS